MKSPLYGKLKKYVEENVYPFHMPGHKMGNGLEENNVFAMDITEINDFDNLFKPEGIIKEAQQLMAKTFGAEESFFLVNGSSSGIIAAITSVCSDGDTILLARNCHKSVFNGLVVSGARPVYIMPTELEEIPVFGAINPKDVEIALEKNPQTKAVVITSPTYEGIVSDIEKISEIAHNYKIPLIVDEAHGAHFNFNHFFPKSAIKCGADMVIQSLHKTLPAPTQTAVLHIRKGLVNEVRLKKTLELVQTSSPSYIFMGMIDKLRDFLDTDGERAFEVYVESLKDLRKYISGLHNIKLLDSHIVGNNSIFNLDLGKIVLYSPCINGNHIATFLRQEKIEVEMSLESHVIAMTTVADTKEGFSRLKNALAKADQQIKPSSVSGNRKKLVYPQPKVRVLPRKAFFADKKSCIVENTLGKICGEFIIPYPPGIPIIGYGEEITEEVLECILKIKDDHINIIGTEDFTLEKVSVLG